MTERDEQLQLFLDATFVAYDRHVRSTEGRRSLLEIFGTLERPGASGKLPGRRLPACSWLPDALAVKTGVPSLARLIELFQTIEHRLEWVPRKNNDGTESSNFDDGHANAMIVGPGGIEERNDVWLGVTVMAPNVRYPDHSHEPEETYLVLSEGEFRQGEGEWFTPGIGGTFYNLPNIKHAMRSGARPLLAIWALCV